MIYFISNNIYKWIILFYWNCWKNNKIKFVFPWILNIYIFRYGKIKEIDLKTPARPPAFAFITFADHRDAEDAIHGRDGHNYDGYRLRCEFAKGDRRGKRIIDVMFNLVIIIMIIILELILMK